MEESRISEARVHRVTAILFVLFVALGALAVPLGALLNARYVSREFAGITGPIYFGAGLLAFAVSSLAAGSVWRAGHPPVRRADTPALFWVFTAAMGILGGYLLVRGLSSWLALR